MDDKQIQKIRDYKQIFAGELGKKVMEDLMLVCGAHVNQDNFDPQSPYKTAYNLGKNRVYRYIQSMIDAEIQVEPSPDCQIQKPETERI